MVSKYPLIAGAAIPDPRTKVSEYPIREMDIGDCFDVPFKKANSVRQSARYYAKALGFKFVTRHVGDSLRVWRIK